MIKEKWTYKASLTDSDNQECVCTFGLYEDHGGVLTDNYGFSEQYMDTYIKAITNVPVLLDILQHVVAELSEEYKYDSSGRGLAIARAKEILEELSRNS